MGVSMSAFFETFVTMVAFMRDLPKSLQFVHRKKQDGTVDSICGYCAKTVATASDLSALNEAETNHKCLDQGVLRGDRRN